MGDDEKEAEGPKAPEGTAADPKKLPAACSVTDPTGMMDFSPGVPAESATKIGGNNALTLHVPASDTMLSMGGVGHGLGAFEFGASAGFNAQTTGDASFEVAGKSKGHIGGDTWLHVSGNVDEKIDQKKHEHVIGKVTEDFDDEVETTVKKDWNIHVVGKKEENIEGDRIFNIKNTKFEKTIGVTNEFKVGLFTEEIFGGEVTKIGPFKEETIAGYEFTLVIGRTREVITGNKTETVGGNETTLIKGNQIETIVGDKKELIKGDKAEKCIGEHKREVLKEIVEAAEEVKVKAEKIEHQAEDLHHKAEKLWSEAGSQAKYTAQDMRIESKLTAIKADSLEQEAKEMSLKADQQVKLKTAQLQADCDAQAKFDAAVLQFG